GESGGWLVVHASKVDGAWVSYPFSVRSEAGRGAGMGAWPGAEPLGARASPPAPQALPPMQRRGLGKPRSLRLHARRRPKEGRFPKRPPEARAFPPAAPWQGLRMEQKNHSGNSSEIGN